MPVLKIPIVHKFGIISHSQRLALQARLLKQSRQSENEAAKVAAAHERANPLQVCEKFVEKFNNATMDEQGHYQTEANRILVHSKRRVGIATQGEGDHVDLPMAWSELAILGQCKGKLQEDCFEILCKSLNHAPLHEENIPTLFFLAESTLYWLRTDTMNSSQLRTAEIRLLKLGFLVFVRLYYHFLVNNLINLDDFKTRLLTYLEDIREHEVLYKSYPGVWLALRFISRVGEIITARKSPRTGESNIDDRTLQDEMTSILIRPIVYQALHVWRRKDNGVGLKKAILDVIICAKDLAQEDWIDAIFAVSILGDAAKANFLVCRSFQDIARGVIVPITDLMTPRTTEFMASTISPKKQTAENGTGSLDKPAELENNGERVDSFQNIMTGMMADLDSALGKTPYTQATRREMTTETNQRGTTDQSGTKSRDQSSNIPGTSRLASMPGASSGPEILPNPYSPRSVDAITTGISAWSWEVAYHYSQIMTDICLHGSTSSIQKAAMLGKWLGADVTTFRAGVPNFCIASCGLVDLLEYRNPKNLPSTFTQENMSSAAGNDWSWKVRYGALSGLLHLTHALRDVKLKEGIQSAAWSLIVSLQDSPATDDRVLEAIRVGQVEYPDFNKSVSMSTALNIWSRVSHGLTEHFLVPMLPIPRSPSSLAQPTSSVPPDDTRQSTQRTPRMKLSPPPLPSISPRKPSPNRTTLKDHLTIPASVYHISTEFYKRNELNLQRIVEDQWRKKLLQDHEEEEKIRLKELKEKQKEEEMKVIQTAEKRQEKLKGKPTQTLGPYEIP